MEEFPTGTLAGAGSFRCQDCGFAVALMAMDAVPECPNCTSKRFRRSSMFAEPMIETAATEHETPSWLAELREEISEEGQFVAFMDDDRLSLLPLRKEWTRVGRSLAADIRLDDPTVSRRHALIVRQPRGVRVLDDRSLNGVFVNGERVDWRALGDGDEVVVGRFFLYFIDTTPSRSPSAPRTESALA